MKRLLIITGDIAAGKTTFSHILSNRYGVASLQKDDLKEILSDRIGFRDREENRRLSDAAVLVMIHVFGALAGADGDLILEANFRGGELEQLHETAREAGYRVLSLVLRVDDGVLYERYLNRMTNEGRSPAHLSASLEIWENFVRYIAEGRREPVPGDTLPIDASDFSFQSDPGILGEIDRFMR